MAVHVRYKSFTLFLPAVCTTTSKFKLSTQRLSSVYFGKRERRRPIFRISFGIERWRYIFSLIK